MKASSTTLSLAHSYDHGSGDLKAYFAALLEGRALGARCPACARVWLPPRLRCPDDGAATEPIEVPGGGRIVALTQTRTALPFTDEVLDHAFVLVAMDGADNLMFGRMVDDQPDVAVGTQVRLNGGNGGLAHPAQAAIFVKEAEA